MKKYIDTIVHQMSNNLEVLKSIFPPFDINEMVGDPLSIVKNPLKIDIENPIILDGKKYYKGRLFIRNILKKSDLLKLKDFFSRVSEFEKSNNGDIEDSFIYSIKGNLISCECYFLTQSIDSYPTYDIEIINNDSYSIEYKSEKYVKLILSKTFNKEKLDSLGLISLKESNNMGMPVYHYMVKEKDLNKALSYNLIFNYTYC